MNLKQLVNKAKDKSNVTDHIKTFDNLLIDDIWKFI